jgi:(S)-citramalyl-CoA lyase
MLSETVLPATSPEERAVRDGRAPGPLACRSMLITCALHRAQYGKAGQLGADIATLDLEDSVPPARKEEARRLALPFLAGGPWAGITRGLRVNALRTPDGLRDVLALRESAARPDVLMVPKVDAAEDLRILEQLLCDKLPDLGFVVIVETAHALCAVEEIAVATPRLRGLVFGTADLSADLGTTMSWEHMLYGRSRTLAAAARAGVPVIDSPCFELDDEAELRLQIRRAGEMGFAGKCAVHPKQVAAINEGFTPQPAAIARALEILDRTESSRGQICVIDGQMIGPPAVLAARRLLASAGKLPR